MQKKIEKKSIGFYIIASELAALITLLRRENFWPVVYVFTKSQKILHITKRDLFNWIAFTVINKYAKGGVVQISTVFWPVYHVAFGGVFSFSF